VNAKKRFVKVVPETFDDFWHLYNVIYRDDEVYAHTTREVKVDEKYGRPRRGERVPMFLGVKVEDVYWDKLLGRLRVHGTVCEATDAVPFGAHHTLNVTLNTPMTIVKKEWSRQVLERLRKASRTSEKPVTIFSIDDEGYAVGRTAQYGVEVIVEQRVKLPGKLEAEKRGTAMNQYFRKAVDSLRQAWAEPRGPIAIIGVGFVKNDFAQFVQNEAADIAKSVVEVKGVNNGGVAGINEALRSGVLVKTLRQLRVAEEAEVMNEVLRRLGKGEPNVAYGVDDVRKAAEAGAVDKIILGESFLREASDEARLAAEQMMAQVEDKGGSVMIVSGEHESGKQLLALGGVVALLRFPVG